LLQTAMKRPYVVRSRSEEDVFAQCDRCKDLTTVRLSRWGRRILGIQLGRHLYQHSDEIYCVCGGRITLFRV